MGWVARKKAVALFLCLFGAGDIIYQAACVSYPFSDTTQLWNSFLFAGRWHDLAGGLLLVVAGVGMLRLKAWGERLGLVMIAGYLNLFAYLCLMFLDYSGSLPAPFFGLPLVAVQAIFLLLFACSVLSVAALWHPESKSDKKQ